MKKLKKLKLTQLQDGTHSLDSEQMQRLVGGYTSNTVTCTPSGNSDDGDDSDWNYGGGYGGNMNTNCSSCSC